MAAPLLKIDAKSSQELNDLIVVLSNIEKPIAQQVRAQSRKAILPDWQHGLAEHSTTGLEVRAIAQTGRVQVSDQNVTLQAGGVQGKKFRNGFDPRLSIKAVEFGADRNKVATYQAKSKKTGRQWEVTRHTQRQFRANRRQGYVAYPTASDLIPHIASLWVQTAVRTIHEAIESVTNK